MSELTCGREAGGPDGGSGDVHGAVQLQHCDVVDEGVEREVLVRHHPEHSSGLHVAARHVAIVLSYGHGHVLGSDPVKVLYGQGACLVTRVVFILRYKECVADLLLLYFARLPRPRACAEN